MTMRPPSKILNAETERELRRAVLVLNDDPRDETAFKTILDFASAHLRIGSNRTATARRIGRNPAHV